MWKKLWEKLLCKINKHEKVFWTVEKCLKERVYGGIFTPYKCNRCRYKSQIFYIHWQNPYPK
jgi:hypothetical protein